MLLLYFCVFAENALEFSLSTTNNNHMLSEKEIAFQIKPISQEMCEEDYTQLVKMGEKMKKGEENVVTDRCRIGNNVVDFFTFEERLRTRSKYNIHFYDFVEQIEYYKGKKFIDNMLTYYKNVKNKNNTKNDYIVLKEVFNICIGAINIFRPLVAMEIYAKFQPTSVLDICAGWGGRCVGAAAMGVSRYTGLDINTNLQSRYDDLIAYLQTRPGVSTDMRMVFEDALNVDVETLPAYDMVFTSPPYHFLEKYSHNAPYQNKQDMNARFYVPLFTKYFAHLQPAGWFVLNVNAEIYESCCVPLFGEAHERIPLKKSKRQNNYGESIYAWKK